jgi:C4-dicarboxylate transporter DctQ subunit
MYRSLVPIGSWLRRRAENVAAALLATMFFVFVLQIVFRYLLNLPTGWAHEVTVMAWLWLVLFGAAFVVREDEEIRLDIIYSASPARVRRVMQVVAAASLVVLFCVSLPAIIDYVLFMKVQKTAYLKVRFDWLFSIYVVFALAMIVRYLWLGWQAIWGRPPQDHDPTTASSGV